MSTLRKARPTVAEYAVDGLIPGAGAGAAMALYLFAAGGLAGLTPGEVLSHFGAQQLVSPWLGALSHLGMSLFYGAIFGAVWSSLSSRLSWWVLGLAYGAAAFAIAFLMILPAAQSPMLDFPQPHFGVSQGIYGLVLAWAYRRTNPTP